MRTLNPWHALLVAVTLLLGGCGPEDREPIPVIQITVLEQAGRYVIDGKTCSTGDAQDELQALADKYRRPITGSSRAYVRINHSARVDYDRVQTVQGWCQRMGLDMITMNVREGVPPKAPTRAGAD